jgi:hypothetical protein
VENFGPAMVESARCSCQPAVDKKNLLEPLATSFRNLALIYDGQYAPDEMIRHDNDH